MRIESFDYLQVAATANSSRNDRPTYAHFLSFRYIAIGIFKQILVIN